MGTRLANDCLTLTERRMGRFTEYSVIGRKLPTEADATPKL